MMGLGVSFLRLSSSSRGEDEGGESIEKGHIHYL